jgi:glycine dehydrogenase subunit 2
LHEFVISALKQKKKGYKALVIAKNLLDYGYHSPTVYFPINIDEAIMIEPTETETKETLEAFAEAMISINERIDLDDQKLNEAPIYTPVRKLDETKANRELDVRYIDDKS